jgi:hypothetical protein
MQQYPIKHYPRKFGQADGGKPKTIFKIVIESIKIILNG